jgi:hypothetical protein
VSRSMRTSAKSSLRSVKRSPNNFCCYFIFLYETLYINFLAEMPKQNQKGVILIEGY